MEKYFETLEKELKAAYDIAKEARKRGVDPELRPEILLAKDMAERVEGLVGPKGISERIRELETELPKEEVAIKIAGEVVSGKFGPSGEPEAIAEQAIRTSLAILTEGVVSAPLEGIVKASVKRNHDGSRYLAVYFAGPIRSAGGSAQALAVLIADYIRHGMGLDRYKPTSDEVERFAEEVDIYNSEAARLQYLPYPGEVRNAVRNIPVEITGEGTERVEVSGYKNLERIETNQLRGGAVLVLAEGVLQKAPKILKYVEKLRLEGWEWLAEVKKEVKPKDEDHVKPSYKYIKDLIAGRPVLGHPSAKGGLRLRYGRARNSGLASVSLHPATMVMLDSFIAIGTQIKTERPGKGAAVSPCDSIEGPVVKLLDGSVVRVGDVDKAYEIVGKVKEILFLGDILVSYGDFLENNHALLPSGYCEEWWVRELERACKEKGREYASFLDLNKTPSQEEAIAIAEQLSIPMHPRYTYLFSEISKEDLKTLAEWLCTGRIEDDTLVLKKSEERRILETLSIPFKVKGGMVFIKEYKPLLRVLGLNDLSLEGFMQLYEGKRDAMEVVNASGIRVMEKAPTYIGARMGRPEKAKERRMSPPVNVLFPIGQYGGRTRDVKKAANSDVITVEVVNRACPRCGKQGIKTICPECNEETEVKRLCSRCGKAIERESCVCGAPTRCFREKEVRIRELFEDAIGRVGDTDKTVKGVIGMTSDQKIPEALEKGILRAKHEVYVFKDGTTRFDATDVPLTHFKPEEIGTSIEELRELGYEKDIHGEELKSSEQVVELKVQDIIIPKAGAEYLLRVTRFIDELLEKVYGMEAFYNVEDERDLVGHLVLGLAPHTSAGILGRIIGFADVNVGYAHPFFHAAKRRNCLYPDTEIPVFNSDSPRFMSLEDLFETTESEEEVVDDFETAEKKVLGLKTLALNPMTGELERKEIKNVIKTPAPKHLIRVRTKSGRSFIASPEHKIMVFVNGTPHLKRMLELTEGEELLIPRQLDFKEVDLEEIDLLTEFLRFEDLKGCIMVQGIRGSIEDLIKRLGGLKKTAFKLKIEKKTFSNYVYRNSIPLSVLEKLLSLCGEGWATVPRECMVGVKGDHVSLPRNIKIDERLMRLFGYYLAEGYARTREKEGYQISFSAMEEEILEDIVQCIKETLHIEPSIDKHVVTISSRVVHHLFIDVFGTGRDASHKRIPGKFFALPKRKVRELLRGYFTGDGSIEKDRLHVTCSSVNQGLLRDIGLLLLRFGIFYRLRSEKRPASGIARKFYEKKDKDPVFQLHYLSIRSSYARIFCEEIGFAAERKQKSLEGVLQKERSPRIKTFNGWILDPAVEIRVETSTREYLYDIEVQEHHNFLMNHFIVTGNCDGDEDGVMLLLDALLNFSRAYLPSSRGGKMDEPLVLTTRLDPKEIDDEAHNIDIMERYPLEFYEKTLRYAKPQELQDIMEVVGKRIGRAEQYYGLMFTHDTSDISAGPKTSSYKTLGAMMEKVEHQLGLASRIRAVDERDVARRVIESHFLPDLAGNLRTFSKQKVRCVSCNQKYRRIPLSGKCRRCGGKLVLTVSKGSVEKYLKVTQGLIEEYQLDNYLYQRLEILQAGIASVFNNDAVKQVSLSDFVE